VDLGVLSKLCSRYRFKRVLPLCFFVQMGVHYLKLCSICETLQAKNRLYLTLFNVALMSVDKKLIKID